MAFALGRQFSDRPKLLILSLLFQIPIVKTGVMTLKSFMLEMKLEVFHVFFQWDPSSLAGVSLQPIGRRRERGSPLAPGSLFLPDPVEQWGQTTMSTGNKWHCRGWLKYGLVGRLSAGLILSQGFLS